jgi:hypothetical protein
LATTSPRTSSVPRNGCEPSSRQSRTPSPRCCVLTDPRAMRKRQGYLAHFRRSEGLSDTRSMVLACTDRAWLSGSGWSI